MSKRVIPIEFQIIVVYPFDIASVSMVLIQCNVYWLPSIVNRVIFGKLYAAKEWVRISNKLLLNVLFLNYLKHIDRMIPIK